jgi:DeoR family glycerol-3-phosphate regulon repressor
MELSRWQTAIVGELGRFGRLDLATLAVRLGTSEETIRRHVKSLVDSGVLRLLHGAVALPSALTEPPFHNRMELQAAAKRLIAWQMAQLVQDGETVMLDTGSTTAYVGQALAERRGLTLVTNSVETARFLIGRNGHRVLIVGGEVRDHDGAVLGAEAVDFVRQLRADWTILSIGAFDLRGGLMDHDVEEAMFARALLTQADRVAVVADSTKFGRRSLVTICPLKSVDVLVTEMPPPALFESLLLEAEIEIVIAEDVIAEEAPRAGPEHVHDQD